MHTILKLPARNPELLISPRGEDGRCVVKNRRTGDYFQLGEQESFLLSCLDGQRGEATIRADFQSRFGAGLSQSDLDEFLGLAETQGLLHSSTPCDPKEDAYRQHLNQPAEPRPKPGERSCESGVLYWRKSLLDPDRLLGWLAPRLWFCWTRGFVLGSVLFVAAAATLLWLNRAEFVSLFPQTLRWETLALVWLALVVVTVCHELAHGLTCKHFGGEVHEIGFLLIFFMPALYCNVSDAWLLPKRSQRLWVTAAGGYFELVLWAAAVFAWRFTLQDTFFNYLAWTIVSICGVRVLLNFNPLLKLDGYYLLSDFSGVCNLRQRSLDNLAAHMRWLLWGAGKPSRERQGRLLLGYGLACWLFSILLLLVMFSTLGYWLSGYVGSTGLVCATVLGLWLTPRLFRGFFAGEVRAMVMTRPTRSSAWLAGLVICGAVLSFVEWESYASGSFTVRPQRRAELRAPVAGFLREIACREGQRTASGMFLARIEVPDLQSRIAQKRAQICEAQSRLNLLRAGPRHEDVQAHEDRVQSAGRWRQLAEQDLLRARAAFRSESIRLEHRIRECRAGFVAATDLLQRSQQLSKRGVLPMQQLQEAEKAQLVAQAQWEQARAEEAFHKALGTMKADDELARRDKELAEAKTVLSLVLSGPRPEEIEAQQAHVTSLQAELGYLEQVENHARVTCPIVGVVTTRRLSEKIGQYLNQGDLICEVEETSALEVETSVAEQEAAQIHPGQEVLLKARAVPLQNFAAKVDRVAPAAQSGQVQSTVTVYSHLESKDGHLRPGMTGYARILQGKKPVGRILIDRCMRILRTEFWW